MVMDAMKNDYMTSVRKADIFHVTNWPEAS